MNRISTFQSNPDPNTRTTFPVFVIVNVYTIGTPTVVGWSAGSDNYSDRSGNFYSCFQHDQFFALNLGISTHQQRNGFRDYENCLYPALFADNPDSGGYGLPV